MKKRPALGIVLAAALLSACVPGARLGSPSLAGRSNLLLAPSPYDEIDAELRKSNVFAACGAPVKGAGPAANLDATLIPSDEYEQEGRRAQALIEPYRFTVALTNGPQKGATLQVTVPAGFVSDFHSTPDAAVGMTLSIRKALEAAVIHDWLYAVGRPGDEPQRELADQVYSDILGHYGVDGGTNWWVSSAVRMAGSKDFGAPKELRFYNKCFYGQCRGPLDGKLLSSPVMALPPTPGLLERLWDLTVCTRYPLSPDLASLQ